MLTETKVHFWDLKRRGAFCPISDRLKSRILTAYRDCSKAYYFSICATLTALPIIPCLPILHVIMIYWLCYATTYYVLERRSGEKKVSWQGE